MRGLNSNKYITFNNLHSVVVCTEMYDEAEKVLKEAIAIMPDHAHFYYSLGVVMARVNRLKVHTYTHTHTRPHSHAYAHTYVTLMHTPTHTHTHPHTHTQEGEELLLKALVMVPDSAKYHTNLGNHCTYVVIQY